MTLRSRVALALVLAAGCGGSDVAPAPAAPDIPDVSADAPEAPEPAKPSAVGVIQLTIDGPDGIDLPAMIWYPALGPFPKLEPRTYLGLMQGAAYPWVPAAPGSWPVVLFSHGSRAINFQSVDLCEAWALAGYVVAAPNHVGNTLLDSNTDEKLGEVGLRRPDDLAAMLSALKALDADPDSPIFDTVDTTRVGVAGHSFGGLTALVVSGAAIDVVGAKARCAAGDDLKGACAMLDELDDGLYHGRPDSLGDIRAGIALSPAIWGLFGEIGLAETTAPVFIGAGALDTITPVAEHAEPIYAALPKPRALAMFPEAGHYGFSNFCDIPDIESLTQGVIAECDADAFIDHHLAMRILADLTIPWLDAFVAGDPAALDRLNQARADRRQPGAAILTIDE